MHALPLGFPRITFNSTTVMVWGGDDDGDTSITPSGGGTYDVDAGHLVMFGTGTPEDLGIPFGDEVSFTASRSILMDLDLNSGTGFIAVGGVIDGDGFGLSDGETALLRGEWTGLLIAPDPPGSLLSLSFDTTSGAVSDYDFNNDGDVLDPGEDPAGGITNLEFLFGPLFGVVFAELNFLSSEADLGLNLFQLVSIADLGGFGADDWIVQVKGNIGPVPEPGTILLMLSGAAGLLMNRKVRKPSA